MRYVTKRVKKTTVIWYWQRPGFPLYRLPGDDDARAAAAVELNRCADAGELLPPKQPRNLPTTEQRFLAKVQKLANGCWQWTGAKSPQGYGLFKNGHLVGAHCAAYSLFVGPIETGLQIDHLCRNRMCVNPGHLEPVTPQENVRRGFAARRNASGTGIANPD